MNFVPATSLIIATYNWPEALRCCLSTVACQKILPSEVIIADDGSDQRTKQLLEKLQETFPVPLVHVWHEDDGFRKSQILNKAIKQSRGEYVIQIDGDVLLQEYFIKDHLLAAEKGNFVRGSRARLTPTKTKEVLNSLDTHLHFYSRGVYNRLNAIRVPIFGEIGQRKEQNCRNVRGSNLAYWKQDFLQVNGYNNALNGWGHEDEELAARLINAEITKKVVKLRAVQYHLHHQELPKPNEPFHRQIIQDTVQAKITKCENGYENVY